MSERDEFERFVTDKFFDIEKDHIGYTSWATAFAWKVWQDTRAAARATQGVPALTAKQRYDEFMEPGEEPSPIERLRFFCSLAMSGQDWLDVEPFFDDLLAATQPSPEPCQHDLRAEYEGQNGTRAAICAKCGERVQTSASPTALTDARQKAEDLDHGGEAIERLIFDGTWDGQMQSVADRLKAHAMALHEAADAAMSASKEGARWK